MNYQGSSVARLSRPALCRVALLAICSSALLSPHSASAQINGTWTGADGATWNTTDTNWTGVTVPSTPWASPGTTANATFSATSGSASVSGTVFANTITYSPVGGNFSIANGTITLAGTTPTINNYDPAGSLTLASTVAGSAGLVSRGAGTLVLSGNNTYTGTTTIKGGPLVLDYSGLSNTADPLSTGAVTIESGAVTLKGKTSGATTETISTFNFQNTNVGFANSLTLDSNGGTGIALTISTFNSANNTNSQNINLIDLSSNAGNSLTISALGSGAKSLNSVLMGSTDNSTGRANLVVRDSTGGYGFATLSGNTSGTIGRLSTGTTLDATNTSSTANYRLTNVGTLTRTANLDYSTITLDSTAGAVTLNMGVYNLAPNGNGRGILVTGPNDVSITGTGRLEATGSTWFHNYSTGTFTYGLSTSLTVSNSLMFGGSGLTVWTGNSTKTSGTDNLYIEGGIFRPTAAQDWTTSLNGIATGGVWVSSGAVLEVGADLNGATAGDLSNTIGTGSGNIRLWGNSGVSAFGGDRIVGFRASGSLQSLTWGSTSFLTDAGGTGDGNYVFKLSSNRSDSTVTVQNAIALGNLNRTIEVANGSAATDAILSGVLSGTGGLVKSGAGALILSGSNTYTGATTINAGTLQIGAGSTTGSLSSSTAITNNGTLAINRSDAITISNTISGTGNLTKLGAGNLTLSGASANTYTGTTTVSAGTLTLDKTSGVVAVGGDLVLSGSNSTIIYGTAKNEQIANTASVTINGSQSVFNGSTWNATTGSQTSITETIGSLTVRDGQFNTGTGGNWTVTGAGVFDGSTGDSRFVGFSGSSISFNSLSLTSMTGTTIISTSDSFVVGGQSTTALTTLSVGSGSLTLNGSTLGLNKGINSGELGSRLILDGNITTTGSSASLIASNNGGAFGISNILLSSTAGSVNRTITTGSGADLTISVPITNGNATTAGIIKDGLGTLTLSGSNTYNGATTINAGTLSIAAITNGGVAGALGNSTNAASNLVLGGGTLEYTGTANGTTNRDFTLTAGTASGISVANSTVSLTISGTAAATTGGLTKSGAGTLILTGANTYTGSTTINAGALQIGAGSTTGSLSSSTAITNNGTLAINRSDAITISNTISGTGNLTKLGAGNLTLSGASANTYTGTTTVSAGTLTLDKTSGVVAVGGDLVLNGSSKLTYNGTKNEQIANTASVTINGSQSVFNGSEAVGTTTGASGVTETIGSLTVRDGQFNTGTGGNWTVTGAGVFDGSTGETRFLGFSGSSIGFNSLSLNAMTGTTLTTDPDSFVMGGGSTTAVTTLSVGSGGLTLNGSTLGLNKGASSTSQLGSRLILDGNITTTGSSASLIASNNGGTVGVSDILLSSTAGSVTRTITTGSGANLMISVLITNGNATAAGIIKDGLGMLTLSNNNTYTGGTTINNGTLSISAITNGGVAGALGNSTNAAGNLVLGGGTLEYTGTASGITNRDFTLTAGTTSGISVANSTVSLTISGNAAATSGGLTKSGAGTLILTGANSYTGATTIAAGTLQIGAGSTTGSLSSSSAITNNGTLAINRSDAITISNTISGTGSLTKSGAGTLTLSNANTYQGTTTINAGAINLTGSNTGSATTVNSGGSLIGTGSAGAVTVNTGGLIGAGNAAATPGTLTVGLLTLNGGGGYTWDLSNTSGAPGTNWDLITATSTTIGATSGDKFTIFLTGNPTNWSPATTYSAGWNILQWGTLNSVFDANAFTVNTNNFTGATPTGTWAFSSTGGFLNLSYAAPSSAGIWTAAGGNWSTASNWQGNAVPSNASPLEFNGSGGASTNDSALTGIAGITFNSGAGSYTLDGTALNITGGITNNSSTTQTVAIALTMAGAQTLNAGAANLTISGSLDNAGNTLTTSGSNTVAISGNISGAGGLTKNGAGSLVLSGANTYTGATVISVGNLSITGSGSLGTGGIYAANISNNGTFTLNTTAAQTLSGVVSGSGALVKANTNTLTLSGSNTYSGPTTINAGTLNINNSGSGGTSSAIGTGTLTIAGGTIDNTSSNTVTLSTNNTQNWNGDFTFTGTRDLNLGTGSVTMSASRAITVSAGNLTVGGIIGGPSLGLTKNGLGTLILSGSNTYTGATTINAGTLQIGAGSTTGSLSSSTAITNNGTLAINRSDAITISNTISGTGNLTKLGAGNLTLSGASANTYTGTTTVSAGTLTLDKTSGVVAVGGDLVLSGSNSTIIYGTAKNEQIANTASVTINGSQSVFNGSGAVGSTTGAIGVTETIGSLTVTNGQFNTGNTGSLGNWTVTGAGVFDGSTGDTRFLGFSGSSISFNSLSLTAMNGTTLITSADSFVMGGAQSTVTTLTVGSGGLTLNGSTLGLNKGSSGHAGSRFILNGNITTTGSSASFIASNNGTVGVSDILLSSTAGSVTRTITTGSGANLTISVPITNGNATTASIIKDGLGTLTLSDNNTYNGATTVAGGTLLLTGNGTLGTSEISISGGTLDMGGKSLSNNFGSLTGGTLSNGTLTNNGGNYGLQSGAVSANLAGTNGLSKTSSSTLTLTGSNTYTGATTISAGNLSISSVSALGSTSGVNLANATTLIYNGSASTLDRDISVTGTTGSTGTIRNSGTGLLTLSGALSKNGTTLTLAGGSNGITVSGVISGSAANSDLVIDGGTTTLANANDYNGPTFIINSGTLNANAAGALPTSTLSAVTINGSSTLALGASQSIASLTGAASSNVTLGANALTLGTTSGNTTYAGRITGSSSSALVKDGASTQVLTGNNSGFTGTTTVNSGTLQAAATGALGNSTVINVNGGSFLVTAENAVNDTAAINLGGGRMAVSGTFNESVGLLTLSANSTIDFSGFVGTLRFSGIGSWASGANLAIWNWSGRTQYGTDYGTYPNSSNLVFTNNSTLTSNLANISFYSDSGNSFVGNAFEQGFTGAGGGTEIIAVPEPETYLTVILLLVSLAIYQLPRLKRRPPLEGQPSA